MTVQTAAALSEHPIAATAVGQTMGEIYERLGEGVDLCVVAATPPFAGALEDVLEATEQLLAPQAQIAAVGQGVIGGGQEVRHQGAISVFAARFPGEAQSIRLGSGVDNTELEAGWMELSGCEGTLLLLADPHGFPTERFIDFCAMVAPSLDVVGGLTSGSDRSGGELLALGTQQFRDGAVGVVLPAGARARSVVSHTGRRFGEPLVVTSAERGLLRELGGRPALDVLMEHLELLDPVGRMCAAEGIQIGLAVETGPDHDDPEHFVIRDVLGANREAKIVATAAQLDLGATVQFHITDPDAGRADLHAQLAGLEAAGAALFSSQLRDDQLFEEPGFDPQQFTEQLNGAPVAGLTTAGEMAPLCSQNHLHSRSVTALVLGAD